ncbi:sugar transferase [Sphingomonas baiyangensis]|uniref:Sugar transferase n=1 Tax=Sphingomonas baiyangensis TaxID=2572576 RepID=A0A4U1L2C5_9SPHN|nr:sugar transferase [Sphingomonas baiyangensis]TKD50155.1 sugar transferase [Sphingomonas baiyangensis]
MKRLIDIVVSFVLLILLSPLFVVLAALVCLTTPGRALHWSNRVGRDNRKFEMPKFRTMRDSTPQLPTHLLTNCSDCVTQVGRFLRRSSLDELPQLWSVLTGTMSLVGPRPALFNQGDLIALRTDRGAQTLLPGVTGWAQVNGRDDLPIPLKVEFDVEYLRRQSLWFDLRILFMTVRTVFSGKGVRF